MRLFLTHVAYSTGEIFRSRTNESIEPEEFLFIGLMVVLVIFSSMLLIAILFYFYYQACSPEKECFKQTSSPTSCNRVVGANLASMLKVSFPSPAQHIKRNNGMGWKQGADQISSVVSSAADGQTDGEFTRKSG